MKITITGARLGKIERHARRALPDEACGLITGRLDDRGDAVVIAVHPSENLAKDCRSFEVDPALHMSLQRRLRDSGEKIIGVYHSHPLGPPQPSLRDNNAARAAAYPGWVWLITALAPPGAGDRERPVTRAFLHVPGNVSGNVPGNVSGNVSGHDPGAGEGAAVFEAVDIRVLG